MVVAVPELLGGGGGEQIDWLEGVQYAIADPGPIGVSELRLNN